MRDSGRLVTGRLDLLRKPLAAFAGFIADSKEDEIGARRNAHTLLAKGRDGRTVNRAATSADALQHVLNARTRIVARLQVSADRVDACDVQILRRETLNDHRQRFLGSL